MANMYRKHMLNRLYQFYQPLPIHLEICEMIHSLLIQGYLARNPFDANFKRYLNKSGKQIINRTYDINSRKRFRTTASCGTLIGFSGMGKTTTINRIISNIPQVVLHKQYKKQHYSQIQLVWLKIDAPSTASLKAICLQFFMKVDELLGTNNYKKYVSRNISIDTMLPLITQLSQNIALGLLIIDETQNIKGRGADQIMNFFVNLINNGINLVLIGTPGAYALFGDELRMARRLTGNAEIIFNNTEQDNQFKFILESLWEYQWTKQFTPLNQEFTNVFYEETQGITDLVIKLFHYSQQKAISTGKEELTVKLVKDVAKEKFKLIKPMLDAVRSGNPYKMAKYEDIRRIEAVDTKPESSIPLRREPVQKVRKVTEKKAVEKSQPAKKPKRTAKYEEGDIRLFLDRRSAV